MSLDRIRVSSTRTIVSGPDTYENSALTSATRGVSLGAGLDVSETGLMAIRPYPNPGSAAQSVASSAHTFTAALLPSSVVRVTADGQAATGAIMPAVTRSGETITLINTGRHNITFNATTATGRVAGDGTMAVVLRSYSAATFVSDGSLWYATGRAL